MRDEESQEIEETSFERQMREADAALDAMPDPNPASSRQVIIAMARKIREKARGRGLEAVWKTFVALGHDISFGTFRDYVYSGTRSRAAMTAVERGREKRRIKARPKAVEIDAVPVAVIAETESQARGKPVRARKMR